MPASRERVVMSAVSQSAVPSTSATQLSESQLLRMPLTAYMNAVQREFFRARLLAQERELISNAGQTSEHLREMASTSDPSDRASLEEEHALELRTRDRERKLLKKIRAALLRIEQETYGYCEETGEPIGVQRLLARPTATLSIEAQERREKLRKLYGD